MNYVNYRQISHQVEKHEKRLQNYYRNQFRAKNNRKTKQSLHGFRDLSVREWMAYGGL